MRFLLIALAAAAILPTPTSFAASHPADPFLGRWALTIPGDRAGWLGITQENNFLDAEILWGGGSVVPVANVYVEGDTLVVTRMHEVKRKNKSGKVIRTQQFTETIRATLDGDDHMNLVRTQPRDDGRGVRESTFTGQRIPALPKPPNLNKLRYADPIVLFDGKDIDQWELTNPRQTSAWIVVDGVLVNRVDPDKHYSYGNLRTRAEFEDFNLTLDINVPEGSNSGIYLRGIYEVQVLDSYGHDLDSHNMGAVYSRITPSVAAEKPAGQWQTMDITLADRHITVTLNGTTIIDNQPLLGCTGGALWSDEFRPGPIYLQGDHGMISYRNIVLRPIKN